MEWYAAMRDNDDTDWGYGSYDFEEAKQMLDDIEGEYIAVIEDDVCVEEIRDFKEDKTMKNTEAIELAERIRNADEWNLNDCAELCEMAGLEDEWEAANGDDFEQVIYKAAEILNVEVL